MNTLKNILNSKICLAYYVIICRLVVDALTFFNLSLVYDTLIMTYCVWGMYFVIKDLIEKKWFRSKPQIISWAFFAITIVSYLMNPEYYRIGAILRFIKLLLVVYVLFSMSLDYKKDEMNKFLVNISLIIVTYTLMLNIIEFIMMPLMEVPFSLDGRYAGIFPIVNQSGFYCYLAIALAFFLKSKKAINKYVFWIANIVAVFMLYCTDSRSSLLSFYVIIIYAFYELFRQKKTFGTSCFLSLIASATLIFLLKYTMGHMVGVLINIVQSQNDAIYQRNIIDLDVTQTSRDYTGKSDLYIWLDYASSWRISLWDTTLMYWGKKPVFGYGLSNNMFTTFQNQNSHNIFMNLLMWSGVLGCLSFTAFLISCIWRIVKKTWKLICDNSYQWLLITVICIFITSLLDGAILGSYPPISMMFWILLGTLTHLDLVGD